MDDPRSSDADVTADLGTTAAGSSVTPDAHGFEQVTGIHAHTTGRVDRTCARLSAAGAPR